MIFPFPEKNPVASHLSQSLTEPLKISRSDVADKKTFSDDLKPKWILKVQGKN